MLEKIDYKGIWYLPEKSEIKVEGTLTFDPDGESILDLTGSFTETYSKIKNQKVILGFTTKGKKITLIDCLEISRSESFPGMTTTCYLVTFIFEGAHFQTEDDIKFNRISANLSKLEEWVNVWGINSDHIIEPNGINVNCNFLESIHFKIINSISGHFNFYFNSPTLPVPDFTIKQTTKIEMDIDNDMNFHTLLESLFHFNLFLTLGVFEDTFIKEIEFTSKALTFYTKENIQYQDRVKLLFSQRKKNLKVLSRSHHFFLFKYTDIKTNFESIIQKFFKLKENISPVIDTIFSSFIDNDEYSENRFLNIVQALELYHRRIYENTVALKTEFQSFLDPILIKLSDQQKKWLEEKLYYKYEPNLRTRLKFLLRKFPINPLDKIIPNKKDLYKLIDATVNTRNYYTHYDVELIDKAYKDEKLFYLTEKLKLLLIIIVLSETGFANIEIENLFSKNGYRLYKYLIDNHEI
jgi:hypothetical protein